MNEHLAEITCVVDRSGSMASIAPDAIGGFNTFLESQKAEPGSARLTLVLFDHEYMVVHESADIQSVPPLDENTFVPRGTTALLDALGRTIDDLGKRLAATPEEDRPGKVIVAILTDGMENASQVYSYEKIAAMITHQRDVYKWDFVFLAANQDAIAEAGKLAIGADASFAFKATGQGVRHAFTTMGSRVSESRRRMN
jgi:hypothetical protein